MLSWLRATPGGDKDRCPDTPPNGLARPARRADNPEWDPPPTRPVAALGQVPAIIEALQEEGLTGVVFRDNILERYAEHCWMLGFVPVKHNALCEALGKVCRKVRPFVGRRRLVAYVIPEQGARVVTFSNKKRWPRPVNDRRRASQVDVREVCRVAA